MHAHVVVYGKTTRLRSRSFCVVGMLQGEFMLCCVFMGIPFLWVIAKTLNPISGRKWLELETDQFISAAADFFFFLFWLR